LEELDAENTEGDDDENFREIAPYIRLRQPTKCSTSMSCFPHAAAWRIGEAILKGVKASAF
jgi:hypothetical protein